MQLYRTNRYVGADRVNDANQIAFGLTSRLFDAASGAQYLAVSVGQAYYFEKPRVVLPDEPPATRDTSDFIAQVSLTAYKNWNLEAGIQWNPEDTRSERSQFRLQYRPGRRSRREPRLPRAARPPRAGGSLGGLADRQALECLSAACVYSLRDSEMLDRFAGFEYKACCYRLRAVARRFISSRDGSRRPASTCSWN